MICDNCNKRNICRKGYECNAFRATELVYDGRDRIKELDFTPYLILTEERKLKITNRAKKIIKGDINPKQVCLYLADIYKARATEVYNAMVEAGIDFKGGKIIGSEFNKVEERTEKATVAQWMEKGYKLVNSKGDKILVYRTAYL